MLMLTDPATGLQVIDLHQAGLSQDDDELQDSMAGIDLADLNSVVLQNLDATALSCSDCDCAFCRLSRGDLLCTDDGSQPDDACTQREAENEIETQSFEPTSSRSPRRRRPPPFMCTYWTPITSVGNSADRESEWEIYRAAGDFDDVVDRLSGNRKRRRLPRRKHKCPSCSAVFRWYSVLAGHVSREHLQPTWSDGRWLRQRRQRRRAEVFGGLSGDDDDGCCWKCRMNLRDSFVLNKSIIGKLACLEILEIKYCIVIIFSTRYSCSGFSGSLVLFPVCGHGQQRRSCALR